MEVHDTSPVAEEPAATVHTDSVLQYQVHELARDVRELTVRVQGLPVLGQRVGQTEEATRRLEMAIEKMGDKFTAALISASTKSDKALATVSEEFKTAIKDFRVSVLTWVTIFALLMGVLIAVLQLVVPRVP